jgi:hypothetical protein
MNTKKTSNTNCRATVRKGSADCRNRRTKDDSLLVKVGELAKQIQAITRRALNEYAPIVDAILRAESMDIVYIEHTLDGLLDFCFDPDAFVLFKKLCRYYYAIDPEAASEYVQIYRDMWDQSEEGQPSARKRAAVSKEKRKTAAGRSEQRTDTQRRNTSTKVTRTNRKKSRGKNVD